MTALSLEDVGAPGATVPFLVEPILLKLEGGRYVEPLLTDTLVELVNERHGGDGIIGDASGNSDRGGDGNGVGSGGNCSRGGGSDGGGRNGGRNIGTGRGGAGVRTG